MDPHAAHPASAPPDTPLVCVFCDYQLSSFPRGGVCPECGKNALVTFEGAAPGTAWQNQRTRAAWIETARLAFRDPEMLAMQIRADSTSTLTPRTHLTIAGVLNTLCAAVPLAIIVVDRGGHILDMLREFTLAVTMVALTLTAIAGLSQVVNRMLAGARSNARGRRFAIERWQVCAAHATMPLVVFACASAALMPVVLALAAMIDLLTPPSVSVPHDVIAAACLIVLAVGFVVASVIAFTVESRAWRHVLSPARDPWPDGFPSSLERVRHAREGDA